MELTGYQAKAFAPKLPNGKGAGQLTFTGSMLRFQPDEGAALDLPLRGLVIKLGGASDRLVFFTHPQHPDVSVYTSDHAVLKDLTLLETPELAAQVRGVQGASTSRGILVGGLLLCVAIIVGLYLGRGLAVNAAVAAIPVSAEKQVGDLVYKQVEATSVMIEDAAVQKAMDDLAAPLLAVIPPQGYPFEFHVVADPSINAFALPGGQVIVHSGLILKAEDPEQIIGVLAHEIAHVTERHGLRNVVGMVGTAVLVQLVIGDMSGLIAIVADSGLRLANLSYSRDAEREADDVGFDYLVAAKIDPRGLLAFFELLKEQEADVLPGHAAEALSLLQTHPATQARIDRLQEKVDELDETIEFRQLDIDFSALQSAVARYAGGAAEPTEAETHDGSTH